MTFEWTSGHNMQEVDTKLPRTETYLSLINSQNFWLGLGNPRHIATKLLNSRVKNLLDQVTADSYESCSGFSKTSPEAGPANWMAPPQVGVLTISIKPSNIFKMFVSSMPFHVQILMISSYLVDISILMLMKLPARQT